MDRRIAWLAVALVTALFAMSSAATASEMLYASGDDLGSSDPAGIDSVYSRPSDGGLWKRIAQVKGLVADIAVSRDGSQLAFAANQFQLGAEQGWDLYLMDADGSGLSRILSTDSMLREPSFSPDGRRIIFTSPYQHTSQIWSLDLATHGRRQITRGGEAKFRPAFSGDGKWIVYTQKQGVSRAIFRVSPDGSRWRQLTNTPNLDSFDADVSIHNRIVFAVSSLAPLAMFNASLYTMELDGLDRKPLVLGRNGLGHSVPRFSPRGENVVFRTGGMGLLEIGQVGLHGSGKKTVPLEGEFQMPSGLAWGLAQPEQMAVPGGSVGNLTGSSNPQRLRIQTGRLLAKRADLFVSSEGQFVRGFGPLFRLPWDPSPEAQQFGLFGFSAPVGNVAGRVFALDAQQFTSEPGPRGQVVRGVSLPAVSITVPSSWSDLPQVKPLPRAVCPRELADNPRADLQIAFATANGSLYTTAEGGSLLIRGRTQPNSGAMGVRLSFPTVPGSDPIELPFNRDTGSFRLKVPDLPAGLIQPLSLPVNITAYSKPRVTGVPWPCVAWKQSPSGLPLNQPPPARFVPRPTREEQLSATPERVQRKLISLLQHIAAE